MVSDQKWSIDIRHYTQKDIIIKINKEMIIPKLLLVVTAMLSCGHKGPKYTVE